MWLVYKMGHLWVKWMECFGSVGQCNADSDSEQPNAAIIVCTTITCTDGEQ